MMQLLDSVSSDFCRLKINWSGASITSVSASTNSSEITAVSSGYDYIDDGWYRVYVVATNGATNIFNRIQFAATYETGSETSACYFAGAQVEVGFFPSSYIKTLGSSVTRAKDLLTAPVNLGTGEGTVLVAHLLPYTDSYGLARLCHSGDALTIAYSGPTGLFCSRKSVGAVSNQDSMAITTPNRNVVYIGGGRWDASSNEAICQGVGSGSPTVVTATYEPGTTLQLGAQQDTDNRFIHGWVVVFYWNRKLTNAELTSLINKITMP
jgi:hypothetical protein